MNEAIERLREFPEATLRSFAEQLVVSTDVAVDSLAALYQLAREQLARAGVQALPPPQAWASAHPQGSPS